MDDDGKVPRDQNMSGVKVALCEMVLPVISLTVSASDENGDQNRSVQ